MKRKSVRAKYKRHEAEVGKILGMWWQNSPFLRAHGSGSAATLSKGKVYHAGDLILPPDFPYCVECKSEGVPRNTTKAKIIPWTLDTILRGGCKRFIGWWGQACRQADTISKAPMVCFTRKCMPVYSAVYLDDLPRKLDGLTDSFVYLANYGSGPIIVMKLDCFISTYRREDFFI